MIWLRWIALLLLMAVTYLAGFNQGMNHGWEAAILYDPQCKVTK